MPKQRVPSGSKLRLLAHLVNQYVEHLGAQERLRSVLTKVNGLALLAFGAAVNAELGIRDDIWKQ
jgi:hypothetical protein